MRNISADCYTTIRWGSCPRLVGYIKEIPDRRFFAGLVYTRLQADPVGVSISLPVQELVLRRIPRYRNPKQRSRAPHAPHASTTVTYRILEVLPLCVNLNESKICRTGDNVYIFLYMLAYVGIRPLGTPKASSSTCQTRAIFSRKRFRPVWAR